MKIQKVGKLTIQLTVFIIDKGKCTDAMLMRIKENWQN